MKLSKIEFREPNSNKVTRFGNMPTKIFKKSSKICSDALQRLFNDALSDDNFPNKRKCANVTPVF